MSRLRLYIDEDAMDADLVRGLRSRVIDVLTAADAGMIRRKDEDHLSLATVQGRALYSFNVADLVGTHRRIYQGDLLAYKGRRDGKRRQILDELTRGSRRRLVRAGTAVARAGIAITV